MRKFDIQHDPRHKQYSTGHPQTFGQSFYEPRKYDKGKEWIFTATPDGACVNISMFPDVIEFAYLYGENREHFYEIGFYDIEENILVQRAVPEDDVKYKAVQYMRDIAEVIMAIRRYDKTGDAFSTDTHTKTARKTTEDTEPQRKVQNGTQISIFE